MSRRALAPPSRALALAAPPPPSPRGAVRRAEHLLCGARAVQVATQHWSEGAKCFDRIAAELCEIMAAKGYNSIDEFRGSLRAYDKVRAPPRGWWRRRSIAIAIAPREEDRARLRTDDKRRPRRTSPRSARDDDDEARASKPAAKVGGAGGDGKGGALASPLVLQVIIVALIACIAALLMAQR